ncbi:DUF4292 domain-containing protein [Flavobacterium lotistagni]|uniref:DUF4292 domain-containing protein n=1 Tax=Flavobacterium lotistagni TaxID=2709660 RepID=UPI001F219DDE|nr:DUF4292 domain-containing protein [Flavobacterium lotistagni]
MALLQLVMVSCKSKAAVVKEGKAKETMGADSIIAQHYLNNKNFKTLYIKADAHYQDENRSQNVNAEIKIKKDQTILISIRVLGITMAKALITPAEVKYYEKINGQYFEGDYSLLSRWLGTDLDFSKMQNLLIGQAIDDLRQGSFTSSIEETLYKLIDNASNGTSKTYYFESGKSMVKKQIISQETQGRSVQIVYPNYSQFNPIDLPTAIFIDAQQPKGKVTIEVDYKAVSVDEDLSFPYSVPEGYERIFINEP